MLLKLVTRGILRSGKARFACAALGIAVAVGALVFTTSYVATNDAQAPAAAMKACAPWSAWQLDGIAASFGRAPRPKIGDRPKDNFKNLENDDIKCDLSLKVLFLTVDYRPGGHVLQGPPMVAFMAEAPMENPYGAVKLTEGRWVDLASKEPEVVCVKASMKRFGSQPAPKLGEKLKFVGEKGTMSAKIVGYLEGGKLPREFPYVFANNAAFSILNGEKIGKVNFFSNHIGICPRKKVLTAADPAVVAAFKSDTQRHMDYARPLLLIAALLTALSLLVNSLLLAVESNRGILSTLRVIGLTRAGVVRFVFLESLLAGAVGWLLGIFGAVGSLAVYVATDRAAFPAGITIDISRIVATLSGLPVLILVAVLFALAPALKVRGMDAAAHRPRPRRRGMAVTFALGFAAFVAVEVWGASLMRGFVPSVTWPDAIVSLLPGGVSSFEVEKLRDIPGVRRISELVPRQCFFSGSADAELPSASVASSSGRPARARPNALFLAAEFLPRFDFTEGDWESASEALFAGDGVVIAQMVSNARHLHKGDVLRVKRTGRPGMPPEELTFPVVGVVDLNWHMVTSRGLVRGLNGAPGMTVGPVFCSLDTMGAIDPRTYMTDPAFSAPMTHLWVEYDASFLKKHGVFRAGRLIEAEIAARLGNPAQATVRLHARDEIADGTLAHGTDVIGEAARVPFVFLAILAIGFVAMLVAETDARRREFATLRAVGATRLQLAGTLVSSAVKTALAGVLAGLPLGVFAGWRTAIGTAAMWPGMPHYLVIPWSVVLAGAAGALAFALAFAVPTALALIRSRR